MVDRQTQERRKLASVLKKYVARTTGPVPQLVVYFLMPDNILHLRCRVEKRLREALCLDNVVLVVDEAFEEEMLSTALDAQGLTATKQNLARMNARVEANLFRNSYSQLRLAAYNQRLYANNKPSNIEAPASERTKKRSEAISTWDYDSHAPGRQYYASYLKRVFGIEMKPDARGMRRENFWRTKDGAGHARRGMHDELALVGRGVLTR